jgi:hypothetical protein
MVTNAHAMGRYKNIFPILIVSIGYALKLFCFSCVAWQSYVCFDKYISQPVETSVSFIPNPGRYPSAVTFCKKIPYSNITSNMTLENEIIEDLFLIKSKNSGDVGWRILYENGVFLKNSTLLTRRFTTASWSDSTFKLCISLQLGNESIEVSQLRVSYKWNGLPDEEKLHCNLQLYVHGWGTFAGMKYEVPLRDALQVFQLHQEVLESVSTKARGCSAYEDDLLDDCLESQAVDYAYNTVGCISKMFRYKLHNGELSEKHMCQHSSVYIVAIL